MALIKIKILPTKKVLSKLIDPDFKIKVAAPTIPKKIPNNVLYSMLALKPASTDVSLLNPHDAELYRREQTEQYIESLANEWLEKTFQGNRRQLRRAITDRSKYFELGNIDGEENRINMLQELLKELSLESFKRKTFIKQLSATIKVIGEC